MSSRQMNKTFSVSAVTKKRRLTGELMKTGSTTMLSSKSPMAQSPSCFNSKMDPHFWQANPITTRFGNHF